MSNPDLSIIKIYIPCRGHKQTIFMKALTSKNPLITHLLCVVLFSFSANINFSLVRYYFEIEDLTFTLVSQMNYYRMLGVVVAAFLLILVYNLVDGKKLMIFSALLYLVSQVNLILAHDVEMVRLHYFLLSVGGVAILFQILSLMVSKTRISAETALAIFFLAVVVGFVCSEIFLHFMLVETDQPDLNSIMGINMMPIFLMICILLFNDQFKIGKPDEPSNYFNIVRFMEIEMLTGFAVFFIIMVIIEGHDVYESTESLLYLAVNNTKYIMAAALLLLLYPTNLLIRKYNSYLLNGANLAILILLFATIKFWSHLLVVGFIIWLVIAVQLYHLFVGNIIKLCDKFRDENQLAALLVYFLMGAIGFYSGYITIIEVEKSQGENALHLSISIVLCTVFLYYLFRFAKDKLHEK